MNGQSGKSDPWTWLHDNGFSWDDVNAIAAILAAGDFDIVRAADPSAGGGLDVERLAVAMNTAQIEAIEIRLGHDLMVPARRIAKAYDASVPSKVRTWA